MPTLGSNDSEGRRRAFCLLAMCSAVLLRGTTPAQSHDAPETAAAHWAYVAPTRPAVPEADGNWGKNPIDAFVHARLAPLALEPSPPADRAKLVRRVYLDLIGVPPTVRQLERALGDRSPDAYDHLVDRLLASPQFGERWARPWLDAARYADSNGFQADQYREVWAYRDWVISALNSDMPLPQFTREQIAGDLLPDASLSQRIATGFHRQTTCNVEAGVDPEENRVNQVADRVNTTATVWLGSSIECAQCHDHPYDSFTQAEYFQLFAFFNSTPMEVKHTTATTYDFYGPKLELPQEEKAWSAGEGLTSETDGEVSDDNKKKKPPAKPSTLVMVELPKARDTFVMQRGNYRTLASKVTPGTPAALHAMPPSTANNRLGLANWLASRDNPLTSRVMVNRWWAQLFGRGIVATAEDFGTQGDRPTHPQLLDWLAVELMDSGWSMKHVLRQIVTSATYQQSAMVTAERLARDPQNRWLARAPRMRLPAETIRDTSLTIAGLLSTKQGGPPIYPPQPPRIWRHVGRNAPKYATDQGEDRFRRGIYVVWRRSAPYPSFVTFDAPDRAACVVKRSVTNTPLQALVLLNDQAYVEAAWALARRVATHQPTSSASADAVRVRWAFRACVAREPKPVEQQRLFDAYQQELQLFQRDPARAATLIGKQHVPSGVTRPQLASWFFIANALLNLDETITKE